MVKSTIVLFILTITVSAHSTILIMPERNDLEVQLDFYFEELLQKIPAGKTSVYLADFASAEKGKRYTVLNENIKGYFRHLANMNSAFKITQDRDLDAKFAAMLEKSRGKSLPSYIIGDAVMNRNDVDIVLYGYISSMQDKLILQIEAFDRRKGSTAYSRYIATREEVLVAKLGISDYESEEFYRHTIGVSFRMSTENTNLNVNDSLLATINVHYGYFILKNSSLSLQIGYPVFYSVSQELEAETYPLSSTETSTVCIKDKAFTVKSYDLEFGATQYILPSKVFKPLISAGAGLSSREYKYYIWEYYSKTSPSTSEYNYFSFKGSSKYYYAIASFGADLYFNPSFFLRVLANYQHTFNKQELAYPLKYGMFNYELYAPPLTFTAGLYVRF
jgi:hypothetical protein